MLNGFAAHFLTDAFAAGHLVNKDDVMDRADAHWTAPYGTFFKESNLTRGVAHQVLADPKVAGLMADKELKEIDWGPVSEQRFSEFIELMEEKRPKVFFNSFARLVHDQLNASIKDPAKALEVTNAKGDTWKLSGDETLSQSPETVRIMRAAVAQSSANLEAAAKLTTTPADLEPYFKAAWDYTPTPTAAGKKTLRGVLTTYTDPDKPETINAFAKLLIDQIELLIEQLTTEGYLRVKPPPAPANPNPRGPKI